MRILRAADRIATPWKNGGGTTREVAAFPPGAGLDAFAWRISLADIAADGPFSAFPGVDRVLTVIDGAGLVLDVEGRTVTLDAASPPLAFPGEAKVAARPAGGPIRDLNLMVRRDAGQGRVRRLAVEGAVQITRRADHLPRRGALPGGVGRAPLHIWPRVGVPDLGPLDAVLLNDEGYRLSLNGHGRTLIVEIDSDTAIQEQ